jgi:hypothetical protein
MEDKLSSEEKLELMRIIGGESYAKALSDAVGGMLDPGAHDALAKSVDASPYLDELHTRLSSSMLTIAEHIEKSDARTQEQVVVLAKGLFDLTRAASMTAKMVKGLQDTLNGMMRQPARGPKAAELSLSKGQTGGVGGAGGGNNTLSKQGVLDLLTQMNMASPNGLSKAGEDLNMAITIYESSNEISKALLGEVLEFHQSRSGSRSAHGSNGAVR